MKVKMVCNHSDIDKIMDKLKKSEFTLSSDEPDIMIVDLNFQKDHIKY